MLTYQPFVCQYADFFLWIEAKVSAYQKQNLWFLNGFFQ